MSEDYRISISKTEAEWIAIDKKLNSMGRKDLQAYIRGRILLLHRQYEDSPKSMCMEVERRRQKKFTIDKKYLRLLEQVNLRTGVPIGTIIDRLIVQPLLTQND